MVLLTLTLRQAGDEVNPQASGLPKIETDLLVADANATNTFLVGELETPAAPGRVRHGARRRWPTLVAESARAQPADADALADVEHPGPGLRRAHRGGPGEQPAGSAGRRAVPPPRPATACAATRCRSPDALVGAPHRARPIVRTEHRAGAGWFPLLDARQRWPSSSSFRSGWPGSSSAGSTVVCSTASVGVRPGLAITSLVAMTGLIFSVDSVRICRSGFHEVRGIGGARSAGQPGQVPRGLTLDRTWIGIGVRGRVADLRERRANSSSSAFFRRVRTRSSSQFAGLHRTCTHRSASLDDGGDWDGAVAHWRPVPTTAPRTRPSPPSTFLGPRRRGRPHRHQHRRQPAQPRRRAGGRERADLPSPGLAAAWFGQPRDRGPSAGVPVRGTRRGPDSPEPHSR